jgi:catechol-2,3-dioxygenase
MTVRPIRLAHIVFLTADLQKMIDWYCTVLGAEVVNRNDAIAFLTYDDEHHRIALISPPGIMPRPAGPTVGFYHSAFTYAGLSELVQTHDRLRAEGITPRRTIHHGPTISLYYTDPDGNDVELQVDRFENARDAQEWMKGPAFTANPIGIDFDIEDLRRRLASGEAFDSIMLRPDEIAA